MDSRKIRAIIHRIYDSVHIAIWALGFAMIAYLIVFIIPHLPEARARAERERIQEISVENKFYCEKWKMPEGTHEHTMCTLDLQAIRAKVEQRMADDMDF
jgi:hypothetical protein